MGGDHVIGGDPLRRFELVVNRVQAVARALGRGGTLAAVRAGNIGGRRSGDQELGQDPHAAAVGELGVAVDRRAAHGVDHGTVGKFAHQVGILGGPAARVRGFAVARLDPHGFSERGRARCQGQDQDRHKNQNPFEQECLPPESYFSQAAGSPLKTLPSH